MVTIEPLAAADFDATARWLAQPDVNEWLTAEWRSKELSSGFVAIAVRNRRNRLFLIRYRDDAAGLVALSDIDPVDRTAMVWYLLGKPELGGKGVTTEAVKQVVRLAFEDMNLASVYAWVMEGNVASRRVLEKAGFREAGRIRQASSFRGKQVDRIYFDVIPTN